MNLVDTVLASRGGRLGAFNTTAWANELPTLHTGYQAGRRRAGSRAGAAMGLLVELHRTSEFDFATELSHCDPTIIERAARQQARHGQAERALAWAERLKDNNLREHARRGVASAMRLQTHVIIPDQ